jgi:hypothetical protein
MGRRLFLADAGEVEKEKMTNETLVQIYCKSSV